MVTQNYGEVLDAYTHLPIPAAYGDWFDWIALGKAAGIERGDIERLAASGAAYSAKDPDELHNWNAGRWADVARERDGNAAQLTIFKQARALGWRGHGGARAGAGRPRKSDTGELSAGTLATYASARRSAAITQSRDWGLERAHCFDGMESTDSERAVLYCYNYLARVNGDSALVCKPSDGYWMRVWATRTSGDDVGAVRELIELARERAIADVDKWADGDDVRQGYAEEFRAALSGGITANHAIQVAGQLAQRSYEYKAAGVALAYSQRPVLLKTDAGALDVRTGKTLVAADLIPLWLPKPAFRIPEVPPDAHRVGKGAEVAAAFRAHYGEYLVDVLAFLISALPKLIVSIKAPTPDFGKSVLCDILQLALGAGAVERLSPSDYSSSARRFSPLLLALTSRLLVLAQEVDKAKESDIGNINALTERTIGRERKGVDNEDAVRTGNLIAMGNDWAPTSMDDPAVRARYRIAIDYTGRAAMSREVAALLHPDLNPMVWQPILSLLLERAVTLWSCGRTLGVIERELVAHGDNAADVMHGERQSDAYAALADCYVAGDDTDAPIPASEFKTALESSGLDAVDIPSGQALAKILRVISPHAQSVRRKGGDGKQIRMWTRIRRVESPSAAESPSAGDGNAALESARARASAWAGECEIHGETMRTSDGACAQCRAAGAARRVINGGK